MNAKDGKIIKPSSGGKKNVLIGLMLTFLLCTGGGFGAKAKKEAVVIEVTNSPI